MPKLSSKPLTEHAEVPLADAGRLEALVASFEARRPKAHPTEQQSTCYVASVGPERDPLVRGAQLAEILALVRSQGGRVVGHEICHLSEPHPHSLLGKGLAREVAERARERGATLLVVDAELSPSQVRNLEDAAGIAVCDREAIILNVFLRHARTRRAQVQVEIAQLEYLRPRIRGVGLDMDQQTGGQRAARGPGETASELLARKLDDRLVELKKAQKRADTAARTQRRQRAGCRSLALVGYTNAGKTSLMNALTRAGLSARDVPFETLDTTSRSLTRHGDDVVLSDTVGFIRRLPRRLLASFESTLAEIVEADLLVIVVDVSDPERETQLQTTLELVEKLGASGTARFYVFNKADRLASAPPAEELARLSSGQPWALLSSSDPAQVSELGKALLDAVRPSSELKRAFVPYTAREALSLIYASCRVLGSAASEAGLELEFQAAASVVSRLRAFGVHAR
jgi:GTP-binding protein HflX